MSDQLRNQYMPAEVTPPGETLQDTLDALGMSQVELAMRMGRPKKTINELIQGKAAITPETALQLEQVLGIPASFWNNRERRYRDSLARREAAQKLASQTAWLKEMPIREMVKRGWINAASDAVAQLRETLGFFGVTSPDQWRALYSQEAAAFRKSPSFEGNHVAVAAWLRRGERLAQRIDCAPYDATKFREVLQQARRLTVKPILEALVELIDLCASVGVAVVVVPELPGTRACGAARWLSPNKALIQLSWRYKSDDQFWFTFFHEASHILLHGKHHVFVDPDIGGQQADQSATEQEADNYASNILISTADWQRFIKTMDFRDEETIVKFAEELGIAPGIVVGKLQHLERLAPNLYNNLKKSLKEFSNLEIPPA